MSPPTKLRLLLYTQHVYLYKDIKINIQYMYIYIFQYIIYTNILTRKWGHLLVHVHVCTFNLFVWISFCILGSTCSLLQFPGHSWSIHTWYGLARHSDRQLAATTHLVWVKARQCAGEGEEAVQNGPDQLRNTERVVTWGERREKDHILALNGHGYTHQRRDGATLKEQYQGRE